MNELQEKIVAAVEGAGGSIEWSPLMDALSYQEQQGAYKHIRDLESRNIIKRVVARNPETGKTGFTVNSIEPDVVEDTATIESDS